MSTVVQDANPSDSYWRGRVLCALASLASEGAHEVCAHSVYRRDPNIVEDRALRQRVLSAVFSDLRDRRWLAAVRAELKPRDTRRAGYETIWKVLRAFDHVRLRREATELMAVTWRPAPAPVQHALPFKSDEREVG